MRKDNLRDQRIGVVGVNHHGSVMKVVEYIDKKDIWVMFEQGNRVHTQWTAFTRGNVASVYDKTVYGVGYIGEGPYKQYIRKGEPTKEYRVWKDMLRRGYDINFKQKRPTYISCIVADEWHNFQNFAKWYNENYYEVSGENMCLDKDILVKGNKVYSSETCLFVPERINLLFLKSDKRRGELPIGVYFDKNYKKYRAHIHPNTKKVKSSFNTKEEAFKAYKLYKEKQINTVADKYREVIPDTLYKALLRYEVQDND